MWVLSTPNIENEAAYIEFIEGTKNAQLPDHFNNLELLELIKTYHIQIQFRTCWKCKKNEFHLSYGRYFTEKKMFEKTPDCKFSNAEKQEVLTWRNTLLRQFKSSTDNNLYPTKVNVIDPTKHNFTEPLSDHTLSMYDRGPEDFCGAHEIF